MEYTTTGQSRSTKHGGRGGGNDKCGKEVWEGGVELASCMLVVGKSFTVPETAWHLEAIRITNSDPFNASVLIYHDTGVKIFFRQGYLCLEIWPKVFTC